MKNRSRFAVLVVVLLSIPFVIPAEIAAQEAQRAGQIARSIPEVAIDRGAQQLAAPMKALVD